MPSSFSAQFTLNGHPYHYNVLRCDYLFYQDTDTLGNAVGQVRSGEIELVLQGTDDMLPMFWAANPLGKMNGNVVFFRGDQPSSPYEKLEFTDGSCVVYTELLEPGNEQEGSYLCQLKIVANKMILNNLGHSNGWLGYQ